MSAAATAWAWAQKIDRSAAKMVLLCLAEHYNDEYRAAFPSVEAIVTATSLNRKTVLASLAELKLNGYLIDTGKRIGRTKQVVVYDLDGLQDYIDSLRASAEQRRQKQYQKRDSSENGTLSSEQVQKRNSTKNGTVPFFPENSPNFTAEQSQKRDTESLKESLKGTSESTRDDAARQIIELDHSARSRFCPSDFEPDEMFHVAHRGRNRLANYDLELARFKAHEHRQPKSNWQLAWISWWLIAKPDTTHDSRNALQRKTDEILGIDRRAI